MWETILAGRYGAANWSTDARMAALRRGADHFSGDRQNGRIQHFVAIKQDISERKATEERVQHLAHHDQLTDLPNRVLLSDRLFQALAQARRDRGTLALMFLDLDQFKPVNDTLGHDIGDLLLKEVALRLQACVPRESDTVSRLGGDEFVILLAQIDKAADAVRGGRQGSCRAQAAVLPSVPHVIDISASIGIAVYPQHGEDVNRL
jgi:diguanylate cyclase (GGDEF)-like protein